MSNQKRFSPTKRKLKKAREDGDVAKSRDLTSSLVVVVGFSLILNCQYFWQTLAEVFSSSLSLSATLNLSAVEDAFFMLCFKGAICFVLVLFPVAVCAFFAECNQVGISFNLRSLCFKCSRLNPIVGLRKMFGISSEDASTKFYDKALEVFKLILLLLLGFILLIGTVIYHHQQIILAGFSLNLPLSLKLAIGYIKNLFYLLAGLILFVALIDFSIEKHKQRRRLMMDIEEMKREFRESDGDPETRARRKELHQSLLIQGLLTRVRKARVLLVGKLASVFRD